MRQRNTKRLCLLERHTKGENFFKRIYATFVFFSTFCLLFCFFTSTREFAREREREREFYFFIFFRTRFVVSMTWALLWLLYSPLFYIISLDNKCDVLKRGQKKRDVFGGGASFFWSQKSSSFFFQEEHTQREVIRFFESVLSNTTTKHKGTNQIAHPFYSKPSSKTPRTIVPLKEDEDGTQTLLETVRVLHRALPEFFRGTGALRRLRAARVLDRHRRLEIRELARMVRRRRDVASLSLFFSLLFGRRLSPFLCVGFTDDDILSLGCDRNDDEWDDDDDDDDGEKHLLRLTTKALLLSMMMRLLSLWNAATRLESPRERLLSITPFVKKGEKCPKKKTKKTHHFFKNNHKRQGED